MVEPIANWDAKVGDTILVEHIAIRGLLKGFFIVKDSILKSFDLFAQAMVVHCCVGLPLYNDTEEPICDCTEENCIDVGIVLQGSVDGTGQHCWQSWYIQVRDWKWCQRFSRQNIG